MLIIIKRGEWLSSALDLFLGSGTTIKVAKELGRNSYGYEVDLELKPIILKKISYYQKGLINDFKRVKRQMSVTAKKGRCCQESASLEI